MILDFFELINLSYACDQILIEGPNYLTFRKKTKTNHKYLDTVFYPFITECYVLRSFKT